MSAGQPDSTPPDPPDRRATEPAPRTLPRRRILGMSVLTFLLVATPVAIVVFVAVCAAIVYSR